MRGRPAGIGECSGLLTPQGRPGGRNRNRWRGANLLSVPILSVQRCYVGTETPIHRGGRRVPQSEVAGRVTASRGILCVLRALGGA